MVYQNNGLIDLSSTVSHLEVALHEYAVSPQSGLKKLQDCLVSFQSHVNSITSLHDVFYKRLSSILSSVEHLLDSGSPYFKYYHIALLSACDALFQIVFANQVSLDRVQQLYSLLSVERSCWNILLSTKNDIIHSPTYVGYEAQVTSDAFFQDQTIDSCLKVLSTAGRVSFHLGSMQGKFMSGRYKLLSAQSIEWLQSRFPNFDWSVVSTNEDKSLKELCELSFLPLFQNSTMMRDSRYRLLNLFERQFKVLFYQKFGALFRSDSSIVDQNDRLVPIGEDVGLFKNDDLLSYFPVRHGGFFYAAPKIENNETLDFSCFRRLGRDFLSYFLYEVSTGFGQFVFDLQECIGVYDVSEKNISIVGDTAWFTLENGVEVSIVLDLPLTTLKEGAFCVFPMQMTDVLVINQAESFFAIPFWTLRKIEAVSSQMASPSSLVKNIWLSKANEALVEPWLLGVGNVPNVGSHTIKNACTPFSKNGYYRGVINGRSFWIDAELVSLVLPYKAPFSFVCFNNDFQNRSIFVHEGRCFDNITLGITGSEYLDSAENDCAFSAILDWMGVAAVLCFESCGWCDALPDGHDIQELDCVSIDVSHENKKSRFSSLSDSVLISKRNYLSFVAGSLPPSSIA